MKTLWLTLPLSRNADSNAANGTYTVHTYTSKDLKNWEYHSDILTCQNNLEDGDILYENGILYYVFEKEMYDKGPSSLNVISSADGGFTWSGEKEILPADADHEPAACLPDKSSYTLYYSSDSQNPGKSYASASVYKIKLDREFTPSASAVPIDLQEKQGILLYDVSIKNKESYFLYSQNYLTDNRLILKSISSSWLFPVTEKPP